ncbi:MAG: plasmid mobilization relaxosome protein MobC [Scytonematopsis contorta HA4267-MV1]|jgi:hypothetical protein|nr:plasmid mobilization relaxosome protein MobC [Scytonematopsis contorta HA4267-MV1]
MAKKTTDQKVFPAGRKPQPKPKRTSLISLRLTESEKEDWETKAEAYGLGNNLSSFVRYCVENKNIPAPANAVNLMLYGEIGRIGNNINQIAYAINRAVKMGDKIDVDPRDDIESLKPLLLEVKQMLLGLPKRVETTDQESAE